MYLVYKVAVFSFISTLKHTNIITNGKESLIIIVRYEFEYPDRWPMEFYFATTYLDTYVHRNMCCERKFLK